MTPRTCMTLGPILALLALAPAARADKPPEAEAVAAARAWAAAFAGADTPAGAVALSGVPFVYAGAEFYDPDKEKPCRKAWGRQGTVKDAGRLGACFDCLSLGTGNLPDSSNEWTVVELKKLPRALRKHRARVARLAKDHVLVVSHFVSAGPEEAYFLLPVTRDAGGKLVVDGLLAVHLMD